MDRDPDSAEAEEILDLRCKVLTLAAAVGDLQPVAQALSVTERSFFRLDSARDFMQCALVNLQATDGQLTWLDGRVFALRSGFDMHAQEKTNRRLGMLTILSKHYTRREQVHHPKRVWRCGAWPGTRQRPDTALQGYSRRRTDKNLL